MHNLSSVFKNLMTRFNQLCFYSPDQIHEIPKFSLDLKNEGCGIVNVEYYGASGNICANDFNLNDARVLCLYMGYSEAVNLSPWKTDTGISFEVSMNCNGKEKTPAECKDFSIRQKFSCSGKGIIGLVCRNKTGKLSYSFQILIQIYHYYFCVFSIY